MASNYPGQAPPAYGSEKATQGFHPPQGQHHMHGQQPYPPQGQQPFPPQGQPNMYAQQPYPPQGQQGNAPPGAQDFMRLPGRLGLDPAFAVDRPELLIMQEKWSFAGDRFHVKDSNGVEVMSMEARVFSLTHRKEFYAPQSDRLLFTLRKRLFEIPQSFYLETPEGQEILAIEGGWSFGTKFEVKFANALAGGQPASLQVRGDWIDRNADITWNGLPVAKVRRSFVNWRELSGRHTYGIEVAPGVDLTLITAIVVAINERYSGK